MRSILAGAPGAPHPSTERWLKGPVYYFSYGEWELPELEMEPPLPPELAWTKMNTSWSHKRK